MELKKTNFICMVENKDKNLLLENTLSGKKYLIKEDKKDEFLDYWNGKAIEKNKKIKIEKKLYEKGFLINKEIKENKIVEMLFNQDVYGKKDLELTIIPTNACNFDCVYCYQKEPYFFMNEITKNSILTFIEKHIKEYSGLKIAWFGGEPLLAKEIIVEIMSRVREICLKNKKPFYSNITTNGYELDIKTFEKLVKNHVRYYQITLDGQKEIHNIQRPHKTNNDSFEKIVNNLKNIRDSFKSYNYKIGIRINLSLKNVNTFFEFIDFLKEEFGGDKHFHIIFEVVRDWGGEKIELVKKDLLKFENINKYMDYITQNGFKLNDGFQQNGTSIALCQASKVNGYVINHDGMLYKCAMILENEKLKKINTIGRITEKGEIKIDYTKMLTWIGKISKKDECETCKFYPKCMGITCPLSVILSGNNDCPETFEKNYEYILKNNTLEKDIEELVW